MVWMGNRQKNEGKIATEKITASQNLGGKLEVSSNCAGRSLVSSGD